jgi:tetratricopeptide (TPR) repeat protein
MVATTLAVSQPAARAQGDEWTTLVTTLEQAVESDNTAIVKDQRVAALRLLAAAPTGERAPLIRYTIAYADWKLAFVPSLSPKEQSDYVAEGVQYLHAALAAKPDFAEALALMTGLYGAQIAKNPDLGMTLGPESEDLLVRALALEPANPRVLLMRGSDIFHTPPEYGGSVKEAEALYRRALDAFAKEPASKPWPNWGRFDAHVLLGQLLAGRGDKVGAKAEYEAALVIAPDSRYVRTTLLPQVVK